MRPLVLIVAPNPFEEDRAPAFESDFWLRTSSGHLASFSNLVRLFNPVGVLKGPLMNPVKAARPLAGYYLESFLKSRGYDARAVFNLDDDQRAAAGAASPTAVALSTTFVTSVAELLRALSWVRSAVGPDVPVVVGGQFVWKHHLSGPDPFMGRPEAEGRPELAPLFGPGAHPDLRSATFVASEFGEHTLLRVLDAVRRGGRAPADLAAIENLVLWTDEGWRFTGSAPEPVDLDRDFTRWDVVDEMPATMVPIRSSVGCPYKCEFCDFVAVHPRLRLRSVDSILEELRLVSARGGTSIGFMDDNALSSKARTRALAKAMYDSGLGLRWAGYLRADRITEEDAVLLARSGLMYGWCGIESGDPDILERMHKNSDPGAARVGIDSLTQEGVHVLATLVLGFPGETRASLDASISFLNGLRHDARGRVEYLAFPFHLLPGSPVDRPERRRELGLTGLFDRWEHPTMSSEDVHATWAPYFFRETEASYAYYGGDNSFFWSPARRRQAIAERKALTVAFLDGAPDEAVQDRFATLHATLRLTPATPPDWREHLAPRERQPFLRPSSPLARAAGGV